MQYVAKSLPGMDSLWDDRQFIQSSVPLPRRTIFPFFKNIVTSSYCILSDIYLKVYVKFEYWVVHPEQFTVKFVSNTNPSNGVTLHRLLGIDRGGTV